MENFKQEFIDLVEKRGTNWNIRGLLGADDKIYPFGSDTKVLSTVFELFCRPLIMEIANRHNYQVVEPTQTFYPDFTLMLNAADTNKIAIDIKTTYRRGQKKNGEEKDFAYTLGSYTSFIRNNTKNITFPFDQYDKHWIIGFLYTRNIEVCDDNNCYELDKRGALESPYTDVEFFIQEKYKIAGEHAGSGNTTNIASFPANNITPLDNGEGPFAEYGEEMFLEYWRHYGKKAADREYTNFEEFLAWQE